MEEKEEKNERSNAGNASENGCFSFSYKESWGTCGLDTRFPSLCKFAGGLASVIFQEPPQLSQTFQSLSGKRMPIALAWQTFLWRVISMQSKLRDYRKSTSLLLYKRHFLVLLVNKCKPASWVELLVGRTTMLLCATDLLYCQPPAIMLISLQFYLRSK